MSTHLFQSGDIVCSRSDLFNDDGAIPTVPPGELLAPAGARGVIVKTQYATVSPECSLYLVRFERDDQQLGPPVSCLLEELTQF